MRTRTEAVFQKLHFGPVARWDGAKRPGGLVVKHTFRATWLAAWLFSGHTPAINGGEGDLIRLGLLLPPEKAQALSMQEGALLAQEEFQNNPATRMKVFTRGRAGQWGADAGAAAQLVMDDGVQGLISPPDGAATHQVLQISGRTSIPVVSLCADSSAGTTGVPWFLRIVPTTEDEATALFRGIGESTGQSGVPWTALVPEGRAGREISHDLQAAAAACHFSRGQILEIGPTNETTIEKQALLNRRSLILLWLDPTSAGKAARHLRTIGYQGYLAGPTRLQCDEFLESSGSGAEGCIVTSVSASGPNDGGAAAFVEQYQKRWNHKPSWIACATYDAATLLSALLRQPQFQKPPHTLPVDFSWNGVTGRLRFDSQGNRVLKLELLRLERQKFEKWKRTLSSQN